MTNRKSTSITVDEDLWIRFKMKVVSDRAKLGEALDKLIKMYVDGEVGLG